MTPKIPKDTCNEVSSFSFTEGDLISTLVQLKLELFFFSNKTPQNIAFHHHGRTHNKILIEYPLTINVSPQQGTAFVLRRTKTWQNNPTNADKMNCSHSANKVDQFQKNTIQSKGYTGYKWSLTFQWPAALPSLENSSDAVDITHWILGFPESWHERTHLRKQKMTSCKVFTHWRGSLRHPKATI